MSKALAFGLSVSRQTCTELRISYDYKTFFYPVAQWQNTVFTFQRARVRILPCTTGSVKEKNSIFLISGFERKGMRRCLVFVRQVSTFPYLVDNCFLSSQIFLRVTPLIFYVKICKTTKTIIFVVSGVISLGIFWRHDIQHDDIQHNDTEHKGLIRDSQHKRQSIPTHCHFGKRHHAECRVLIIIMLNVIMLNVIMLNVIMLNVIMLCVVMLSVMAPIFLY